MSVRPSGLERRNRVRKPPESMRRAQVRGAEVRRARDAEGHYPRRRHAAPKARKIIVRIDHRRGVGRKTRDRLALRAGHSFEAAESFEVLSAGVGDEAHRRPRHLDQVRDFPRPVGAHLDDRETVSGLEPQQRQGHADVVVEIAACRQGVAGLGEDRRRHFLGRGLAVAARHADDRNVERLAPGVSGASERRLGVGDDDLRQAGGLRRIDERPGGTGCGRGRDEFVAVEAWTAQGHEEIARRQRAAVARYAGEGAIGTLEPSAAGLRKISQRPLDHRSTAHGRIASSAARATL